VLAGDEEEGMSKLSALSLFGFQTADAAEQCTAV
jgi:hypothetical protein